MKKKLLLLPFLMTLIYNGCTPRTSSKSIQTNSSSSQISDTSQLSNTSQRRDSSMRDNFSYNKIQTVQGETLTMGKSYRGFKFPKFQDKIVLIQVFGQDCPHCFQEIPIVNSLQAKYKQRVQVVAFQVQQQMSKKEAYDLIKRFNITYPIINRDDSTDLMYTLKDTYEWNGVLPFILLVKDGITQEVFRGEKSYQQIERAIKELL